LLRNSTPALGTATGRAPSAAIAAGDRSHRAVAAPGKAGEKGYGAPGVLALATIRWRKHYLDLLKERNYDTMAMGFAKKPLRGHYTEAFWNMQVSGACAEPFFIMTQ